MKNKLYNYLLLISLGIFLVNITACKENKSKKQEDAVVVSETSLEEELYRPNFHFTPEANWMNDPNGMFYLNGKYHLYFQYYPESNVWGPMHWGHAISDDMINWKEQPIALYPDDLGLIFSGSIVVDTNNTSGFGENGIAPVVAIFTHHNMQGEKDGKLDFQTQSIAYSLDEGFTWTKYSNNPVISNPGIKDFRDPKVIWDDKNKKWIMSLAAGNKIMFYSSTNLKEWNFESDFGENLGQHGGLWECPDLFPIKVDGSDETKWVLIVSINPAGPNGGSATQYFIGDFNGKSFELDKKFSKQLNEDNAVWLDYGRDNYAGVTWSNIPETDGRKLFIGWMSNWEYARDVPTFKWRSTMTIARELKLKSNKDKFILHSLPVDELNSYSNKTIKKDKIESSDIKKLLNDSDLDMAKLNLEFELNDLKEETYNISFYNKEGDTLIIGLNNLDNKFFINRQKSGKVDFSEKFAPNTSTVSMQKGMKSLKFQILLDKTSIEIFLNDGEIVMTELFFPNYPLELFSITSKDKTFKIENLQIQEFKFN
ncbi:glycoside hydrolase family 32 protein [uncultured Winogradskyella sp.]|uniref:glycoside hydrolase family 32 protein n=1 Tax=uncultured Winogradskyella sp. TaxID=395353 RepID=UPI002617AB77|nr:glycoside hydrolase family 32 protein [uncultured Winogradskyella sp.]